MQAGMDVSLDSKTLYVGNLSDSVGETLMRALFGSVGTIANCKMIYESGQDPYCFVEFADHYSASQALNTMNGREVMGKEMKVNWATSPNSKNNAQVNTSRRVDTSDHFHIFCGDLSPDIKTPQLREAFMAFGELSDCKVISDPNTTKSKGYGFISFVNKEDAQKAINEMNGAWLGQRAIRTNWASRKPPAPTDRARPPRQPVKLDYDEMFNQASATNCTVFCGGVQDGLNEGIVRDKFRLYGDILEVRVFPDKGYAFIRYNNKEHACRAIVGVNGEEISGYVCRCSWGKESNTQGTGVARQQSGPGYNPDAQWGGQWNPQQQQWGAGAQQWGGAQQQWGGGAQQWGGGAQYWGGGDQWGQGGHQANTGYYNQGGQGYQ